MLDQLERLRELEPLCALERMAGWAKVCARLAEMDAEAWADVHDCRSSDERVVSGMTRRAQTVRDVVQSVRALVTNAVIERHELLEELKTQEQLEETE